MASSPPPPPPRLQVSGLPALDDDAAAATISPARGAEMRNFLQARLQKNRAPPLVHTWDFYHDRQDRSRSTNLSSLPSSSSPPAPPADESGGYATRLEHLAVIDDVRKFWNVFNNFDLTRLALRDAVHLFHRGVRPVWEDPRNARGGSWTFRVPKSQAAAFWQEICLMAIGEQLQAAVEDPARETFRDDICGVSLAVRFNSVLVQVWNRDAGHEAGVKGVLECVLGGLSEGLVPREGAYYYKKHSEHAGFAAAGKGEEVQGGSESGGSRPTTSTGGSIDEVVLNDQT